MPKQPRTGFRRGCAESLNLGGLQPLARVTDQGHHDALDDQFLRRDQVGVVLVLGFEEGASVANQVSLQGGFPINEGGHDVAGLGITDFQDNVVTAENMGVDHGVPAHFECKGAGIARNAEGLYVHRNAAVHLLLLVRGKACGNLAVYWHVHDLGAVSESRKDHSSGDSGVTLDGTFFLQCFEMSHGRRLTAETKVPLDIPRGRHHAVLPLVIAQEVQELALAIRQVGFTVVGGHGDQCSCEQCAVRSCLQVVSLRSEMRIVSGMKCLLPISCMILAALLPAAAADKKDDGPKLGVAEGSKTGMLPPDTQVLANKAAKAFAAQDWKSARLAYKDMIAVDPENSLAWANLGAVEQQAGNLNTAIECFEKSVGLNPDVVQSWLALGQLYSTRGDKYRAVSAFTRAIHEDPEDSRAHNFLAIVAKSLGWMDAAEAELQRAIELNPGYGIAHFNLALMYLERKPPALELAKRHYSKAVELGLEKDEIVERKLKE